MNINLRFCGVQLAIFYAMIALGVTVAADTPETPQPGKLVYYSTLDSAEEIIKPAVGEAATCGSAVFSPGVKGSALSIESSTSPVRIPFPNGLPAEKGCLEFWAQLYTKSNFCWSGGNPRFYCFNRTGTQNSSVSFIDINSGNGANGAGFTTVLGNQTVPSQPSGTSSYATIFCGLDPKAWHHYELTWNIKGLAADPSSAMMLKLDDVVISKVALEGFDGATFAMRMDDSCELYFPLQDGFSDYSRVPYVIDEFKVWDSDVFVPDPNVNPNPPPDPLMDGVDVVDGVTWYYTLAQDGNATVVKGEIPYAGELEIPAVLDGHSVVATAQGLFQNNKAVTRVFFPDSVRSIGGWTFDQATSLVSVRLPETLDYLGDSAFSWCAGLTDAFIPAGLTRVEKDIFHSNASMTSAVVPEGVKSMGRAVFYNCTALKTVVFPASFNSFDYTSMSESHMQFGGCRALEAAVFSCATPPANLMRSGLQLYGKIYYPKAHAADWEAVVPEEKFGGYAEDYGKQLPITLAPLARSYVPGLAIEPIVVSYTGEAVKPVIAVKGLPKGLVFKNGVISGTPTMPGVAVVTVSVTAGGKVVETREVDMRVTHYTDALAAELAGSCGPFIPGVPVAENLSVVAGWKASGLPSGLKFERKTGLLTGTPTKPGSYTVLFKQTVGPAVHVASTTLTVAPLRTVSVTVEGLGTVKGAGDYAANAVAKLTAKPGKGYAVAGWFRNGMRVSRDAAFAYSVGTEEVQTLTVKFVPGAEDAASLACAFDGAALAAEGAALCVTNYQGVAAEWPVAFDALTQPTLKASGLPAGLAFKDGVVAGVPTTSSRIDKKTGTVVPTTATFTLKTLAGNTAKYKVDFVVLPRGTWAAGTYAGAWLNQDEIAGSATFTLAANGKGSGRITYAYNGKSATATLTSAALVSYDPVAETAAFVATLKGTGLETQTMRLAVRSVEGCGVLESVDADDAALTLVQDVWKRTDVALPTFPTGRAALSLTTADGLVLTFGAKGAVKFAGKVPGDTGADVSVSGSATICAAPMSELNAQVLIYVPAKKGLAQGFACLVGLRLEVDAAGVVTSVVAVEESAE